MPGAQGVSRRGLAALQSRSPVWWGASSVSRGFTSRLPREPTCSPAAWRQLDGPQFFSDATHHDHTHVAFDH
jgi:hypothetical protein